MRNINIHINKNHTVDYPNGYAGLNLENLQGNITFEFDDFVKGNARAEIVINDQDGYILLDQVDNTYTLPIKSSLLTGDSILMQLVIDEVDKTTYKLTTDTEINHKKTYYIKVGNNFEVVEHPVKADLGTYYEGDTPVWKSEVFYLKVGTSINAIETIPEQYPSWIEVINGLINQVNQSLEEVGEALTEMDNLNISVSNKVDGKVTITFTDKEGTTKTVTIDDGIGIESIQKTSTSGNVDTYTITYTDGNSTTFEVTNGIDGTDGVGITSIYLTGSSGLTDTYTILYTNGDTTEFQVKNGKGITKIEKISTTGLIDTYKITYNDGTNQTYEVGNGRGITSIVKTSTSGYVDTYTITYNDGTTSTFDVTNGEVTQEQLDEVIAENDYLNSIIDQIVPKVTGSGEYITLNNTIKAKMDIDLYAKLLSQFTTTGKNLLEITSTNFLVHCSYVSGANTNEYKILCTQADMYVNEVKAVGRDYEKSVCGNLIPCNYGETIYFNTGNNLFTKNYFTEFDENLVSLGNYNKTMSSGSYTPTNANCKYVTLRFGYGANAVPNTTYTLSPIISKTQITDYEPYTGGIPAPNPQYPQDIHTISGSNTIRVEGTQLFDKDTPKTYYYYDGSGNKVNSSQSYINQEIILASKYTISFSSIHSANIRIVEFGDNNTFINRTLINTTPVTVTTNANTKKVILCVDADTNNYVENLMINTGETALPYTPYIGEQANIDLGNIEYCKIGDYEDVFRKSTGKNLLNENELEIGSIDASTGQNSSSNLEFRTIGYIEVDSSTNYTLSNQNYSSYTHRGIFEYDENHNYIQRTNDQTISTTTGFTLQTSATTKYVRIRYIVGSTISQIPSNMALQYEKGSTATDYEPYGTGWYLKKNVYRKKFDGTETLTTYGSQTNRSCFAYVTNENIESYTISNQMPTIMCTHLIPKTQNDSWKPGDISRRFEAPNTLYIILEQGLTTTTGLQWLVNNNLILYTPLSTPTYTPITGTLANQLDNIKSKLLSQKGQTNISQVNNDLPFEIFVSAFKELN
mgnify:CR=1 FL=1